MQVEVSSLINNRGERLEVSGEAVLEPLMVGWNCFRFNDPVRIDAVFISLGDSIELNARASGKAIADCARCSCDVVVPFEFEFQELLKSGSDQAADPEAVIFNGSVVDLDSITADNLALHAPMRVLCKEGCKGLCPKCGTNLNAADCGCKSDAADPRFSVLDELFKELKNK